MDGSKSISDGSFDPRTKSIGAEVVVKNRDGAFVDGSDKCFPAASALQAEIVRAVASALQADGVSLAVEKKASERNSGNRFKGSSLYVD